MMIAFWNNSVSKLSCVLALKGNDYCHVLFVALALIFGRIVALVRISETNPDLLRIESITDVESKDCKC